MIAASPTDLDQGLCPVPTIGQYVEFTRDRELNLFDDSFCQLNLCTEVATSLGPLGMIEFSPKGQEEVPIKQRGEDPLMAKDILLLGMIFMPSTPGEGLPRLSNKAVIDNEKEDRLGFDSQGMEEFFQSDLDHFFCGPNILPQEPSKAAKGSVQEGKAERLNHRGGVGLLAQLDKSDDKGRKDFERRP